MRLSDDEKRIIKVLRDAEKLADFEDLYWKQKEELRLLRTEVANYKRDLRKVESQISPPEGAECPGNAGFGATKHHSRCTVLGAHDPLWFRGGRWREKPKDGDRCTLGAAENYPRIHNPKCFDGSHVQTVVFNERAKSWIPVPMGVPFTTTTTSSTSMIRCPGIPMGDRNGGRAICGGGEAHEAHLVKFGGWDPGQQ